MLEGELVEALEGHPAAGRRLGVERLGPQGLDCLAFGQGRGEQLVHPRLPQGLLDLGSARNARALLFKMR